MWNNLNPANEILNSKFTRKSKITRKVQYAFIKYDFVAYRGLDYLHIAKLRLRDN